MKTLAIASFLLIQLEAFVIRSRRQSVFNFLERPTSLPCTTGTPTFLLAVGPSRVDVSTSTDVNPCGVDRVSICFGELCKCQEEQENAESIMNDLLSRDLPYVVEEAPCLGACGIGAMVSIEYEDGGYDLVTGLQETHDAVGIVCSLSAPRTSCNADESVAAPFVQYQDEVEDFNRIPLDSNNQLEENEGFSASSGMTTQVDVEEENLRKIDIKVTDVANDKILESQPITKATSIDSMTVDKEQDHGAVQRMRNELNVAVDEKPNPWVNMALYLAQKAKESVIKQ
jgi:hypothetical protein